MANCGIYCIINTLNYRFYIGSSVDIKSRWQHHQKELNKGIHGNKHLQHAWLKYGGENFKFIFLEPCECENRIKIEQSWLDECRPYYNILPTARWGSVPGRKGTPATPENKQKLSIRRKGCIVSEETRAKISAAHKGMISKMRGIPRSPETKAKIGAANKGKKLSAQTIEKIVMANTGKKRSLETRRTMNISHIGKKATLETRTKMSVSWIERRKKGPCKGTKHTPETRAKLSAAWIERRKRGVSEETRIKMAISATGRKVSEESRKKISIANTGRYVGIKLSPERIQLSLAGTRLARQRRECLEWT